MKKILTTILMITLATAVFAGIALAETGKGTVNASELNFRESANTNANAIDVLYKGTKVNIISEEGDWYKVKYNNEEGYVSKQYITREGTSTNTNTSNSSANENTTNTESNNTTNSTNTTEGDVPSTEPEGQVDPSELNKTKVKEEVTIYVLPLINSTKLAKINANTEVVLMSVNGEWSYIQTQTNSGWILTKTLEKTSITLANPTTNSTTNNDTQNENNTNSANTVDNTTTNETNTATNETNTTDQNNTTSNDTGNTTTTTLNNDTTQTSSYPTTMYVNVEAVNVRSKANTTSEVVTSVGKNVPITVEAKEGDWYKVKTSDGNGYIKSDYLSKNKN